MTARALDRGGRHARRRARALGAPSLGTHGAPPLDARAATSSASHAIEGQRSVGTGSSGFETLDVSEASVERLRVALLGRFAGPGRAVIETALARYVGRADAKQIVEDVLAGERLPDQDALWRAVARVVEDFCARGDGPPRVRARSFVSMGGPQQRKRPAWDELPPDPRELVA